MDSGRQATLWAANPILLQTWMRWQVMDERSACRVFGAERHCELPIPPRQDAPRQETRCMVIASGSAHSAAPESRQRSNLVPARARDCFVAELAAGQAWGSDPLLAMTVIVRVYAAARDRARAMTDARPGFFVAAPPRLLRCAAETAKNLPSGSRQVLAPTTQRPFTAVRRGRLRVMDPFRVTISAEGITRIYLASPGSRFSPRTRVSRARELSRCAGRS